MKESHNFDHSHAHTNQNMKAILITFLLNFGFAIIELITFLFTGSMIMYTSSIHDFGDTITLLFTLIIEGKANSGRDNKYTYGYRRYSLIAAIINYSILFFGSIFALLELLERYSNPNTFNPNLLIGISVLGMIINICGFILVKRGSGLSKKSLSENLFSDIVNFAIILFSSLLIKFFNFYFFDIIFSFGFSIYFIIISIKAFREMFEIIMQAIPKEIDYNEILATILEFDFVKDAHDLHIWNLDSEDYILTVHIVLEDNLDDGEIMKFKDLIREKLELKNINHSTIEIDNLTYAVKNGELTT